MSTQTLSQIYVETRFSSEDQDLKESLKMMGVQIGYPFLEAPISSEAYLFEMQQVFDYYGWELVVEHNYYIVRRKLENRL